MYNVRYKSRSFVVEYGLTHFLIKVAHELVGDESRETLAAALAVESGAYLSDEVWAVIRRASNWNAAAAA